MLIKLIKIMEVHPFAMCLIQKNSIQVGGINNE